MTLRLIPALAAAAALAASAPAVAQDATALTASTPADGAELIEAPAALELAFDVPVILDTVALAVATGGVMTLDVADIPEGETVSVPLPALGPGTYTVVWRVADAEGASRSGSFSFTVG